jgi:cytosol alanyl aminopeptidase
MLWMVADALAGDRLEGPVRPTSQRVELAIDPARTDFSGTTSIRIEVSEKVTGFSIHADELALESVAIGRPGRRAKPAVASAAERGIVRIDAGRKLKPGEWEVHLDFVGQLRAQTYGLYRFEVDGAPYVASQFQADDARTAWPCFDEPSFKVPLELVVTAPEGLTVIGNAPVAATAPGAEGQTVTRLAPTPPIPMYAAALLVGPYSGTEIPGLPVPGSVYTVAGHEAYAEGVVQSLPQVVDGLEDWFGTPQPYAKLDVVVVPEFSFGAMENPGAIVAAEQFTPPPARATPAQAEYTHHMLAHEVAHLWFGDLVTMRWWDDLWLNEAFAEWMGRRITHEQRPEFAGEIGQVQRLAGMLRSDAARSSQPLRTEIDPTAVFETSNFAVYPKGEALLDMVERWIGPEAFQTGLRAYLERHAWGNAAAADLFAALGEASGQDVGAVMNPYLDHPGAPWLQFEGAPGEPVTVTQRPLAMAGAEPPWEGPWTVPIRVRVGRSDGSAEVVTAVVEPGQDLVLELGDDVAWFMPAADGIGYYAWSVSDRALEALLAAEALTPAERANVVQMLGIQRLAGARTLGDVLARVAALTEADDLAGMEVTAGQLGAIRLVDVIGDPALVEAANGWLRARLRPVLDRIGVEPAAGEPVPTAELRTRLLYMLAEAGDPDVVAAGEQLGLRAASDPSLPPALAAFGLRTLARHTATPTATQQMLLEWAEAAPDAASRRRLLGAFGQVVGAEALEVAFARAVDPETPPSDATAILLDGVTDRGDEAEGDRVLELAMANHEALLAKTPPVWAPYLARFGSGCSEARLERTRAFYGDEARVRPGTDGVLAELADEVGTCRRRIEEDAPSLRALLGSATAAKALGGAPSRKASGGAPSRKASDAGAK